MPFAIADEYSITTSSWVGQSASNNAQVQSQIEALKNRRSLSSSGHRMKGNLSLANSAQSVAKLTQSNKLQEKEQLRIARKNTLIKMLEARPTRQNLMMVNSNKTNNEQ